MFSRYIDKFDFKSRFRILKGGKVSLVVSAMLVGGIINTSNAVVITNNQTTTYPFNSGNSENLDISNTGSIDVTDSEAAIYIMGNLSSDKKIDNEGLIRITNSGGEDAYAIYDKDYYIYGNIINQNKIESTSQRGALGIAISYLDGGTIQNNGFIDVKSLDSSENNSYAYGILLESGEDSASIINGGKINVSSEGESFAILMENSIDSSIENSGELEVVSSGNYYAQSAGIFVGNMDNSTVTNSGTMYVRAGNTNNSYANATGINIYGTYNSDVINSGTIEAVLEGESGSFENYNNYSMGNEFSAIGMSFDELHGSNIQNTGTIKVHSSLTGEYSQTRLFGIFTEGNVSDSTITNSGNILIDGIGTGSVLAAGIQLDMETAYEIPTVLTNSGNIKVNIDTSNYEDSLTLAAGISTYNDSNELEIVNEANGVIAAYINNELDKNAYSLHLQKGSESGSYNVNNSGILKGNIFVDGTLTNSGKIELAHNAMVEEINVMDEESVAYINNFTNEATGQLIIGLKTDGTIDGTKYSQLLTNNTTFKTGSTIDVNVLNSSTNQASLAGNKLENVVTANSLTIDDKIKITDNSALLNFEYETSDGWVNGEDGAIHLNVVKASENNIVDSTILGGGNKNDQNAAKAIQSLYDIDPNVASAFNNLPTDSAVAKAVESTTPVVTNGTVTAGTQISNGISTIVTQRQNANILGGLNSGDGMFSENNLWIKPFGSIGKQNNKDGINGFDLKTYGLGFGADTEIKNNSKLGLAFFYTNGNVDINNVSQKADLDVFTTLVYGNVPIIDDKTNFLYQAGYSWQKTDTKRDIFTGQTAESKYTSKVASLDLKLMRDVNVTDKLLLQPIVNATYRHFTNPAYSENGAGALNLNVDKFTTSELILGLGTLAHYKISDNQKLIGNLNVGYDLQDKNQMVTSSYQGNVGTSFDTNGIDNGRWSYEAGIGYELDINKTNNINISYDYQGQGTDFSNNVISAKYVLKF
ncbi:autotransporter domain-containing protein [Aliarcobacter faecis]|uniref:autotransporter family protein n=1 Tax=Aliarcobacter faecis TaxID=1564138 RepID=UPI000479E840|nr:autotransporter outer membrane beta-barrel domain-containing protein [Aliarcobacter faecis]QKF73071.1 autotransporter domain-containing protein [Aliarcobacter faecis]